jgi:colicin import membrane protein
MPLPRFRRSPGRAKAVTLAVALHVVVIGFLVIGFNWPTLSGRGAQIVQAVVVDADQLNQEEAKKKAEAEKRKQQEEAQKKAEAEKRKQAEEARRAAEEQKRQQAEEERKRQAAEQQRLAAERKQQEEARKKAQAEQQRVAQERQRLAAEQQRIEQERQRIEQEAQRQQIEQDRKQAEQQLAAAVAAEEQQRQEAALRARAMTAAEKYKVLIRQKVSRNWSRPAGTAKGLQCLVRVRLAAGGEVMSVSIVRSSGNQLFDRSVENAVNKASPLPLPEDKDLFEYFREIEFLFNPEA